MLNPALERELQHYLAQLSYADQRKVLDFTRELTTKSSNSPSVDSLEVLIHLYEGMTDNEIQAVESIILNRGPFFSRETGL